MKRIGAAAIGAAMVCAVPSLAGAQPYYRPYGPPAYAPYGAYDQGRSVYGAPRVCQKLCSRDLSPCDPPEFKRADGRCTDPLGGTFF